MVSKSISVVFIDVLLKSGIRKKGDTFPRLGHSQSTGREAIAQKPTLAGELRPSYVVRQLDENLASDHGFAFTGDVGINTLWLFRYRRHHSSTVWSRNFATMGFGLPAALARAQLTGKPTVAAVSYTHLTLPTNREV